MSGPSGRRADREHWRRAEALVADIEIPDPFDLETFCRLLGERRGRRLQVVPHTDLAEPAGQATLCGVWIGTEVGDYVFYDPIAAPLHQEHIVLHEIGHMLNDHQLRSPVDSSLATRLMPHLRPELVQRVLARTSYDSPEEREAEIVATLIGARITRRVATQRAAGSAPPDLFLDHLARVFGGPAGTPS